MARSKRGSRPITIDGLNYRWRARPDGSFVVWHVLDEGLLQVEQRPDERWIEDAMPADVARVIRRARANGWRTSEHLSMQRNELPYPIVRDASIRASIDLDPVGWMEHHLGVPALSGEVGLRISVLPGRGIRSSAAFVPHRRGCVIDLSNDEGGSITLYGRVDGVDGRWRAACDGSWLRDVIVDLKESPSSETGVIQAGFELSDPGGRERWRGSLQDPRFLNAARGAWRIAHPCFLGPERSVLERLHPSLELPEDPWEVHTTRRCVRVFGVLTSARLPAFLKVIGSGGWVVDARCLLWIDQACRAGLHEHRDLGDVWVAKEPHDLERPWVPTLEQGFERTPPTVRAAMARRLALGIDPRWSTQVLAGLGGGTLEDLDRWLGDGWTPVAAPSDAIWYDGQGVRSRRPDAPPWLALNAEGLVVGLARGCLAHFPQIT